MDVTSNTVPGHDAALQLMAAKRLKQTRTRCAIGLFIVLCYGPSLGYGNLAAWFALYLLAQTFEIFCFRFAHNRLAGARRLLLLVSYSISATIFLALVPAICRRLGGGFGLGCSAFLIAGALLTGLQTTVFSGAAFVAVCGPVFLYAFALPAIGYSPGVRLGGIVGLEVGALATVLYTYTTWLQARRALLAEEQASEDLRERERQAQSDKAFLDAVVENMPVMLLVKEQATGRYRMVNRAGEALLGRDRGEMVGRTDHDLFPEEQADTFVAQDRSLAQADLRGTAVKEQISTPEGLRDISVRRTVVNDEQGASLVLVLAEDITEAEVTSRALEAALEASEQAGLAKSAFLATMSHEIRTPLNGILGMAQVMAANDLVPPQRERLAVLRQAGDLLLAVLNDVLDLSKVEAGKLELELADFDLGELLKGARGAFSDAAKAKSLSFSLSIEPSAEGRYRGDSVRLRQILYNLISNALKFTEAGEVRVSVRADGEFHYFQVRDTGIGMTPEQQKGLFQKFVQADATVTRRFGGTGLGLAISRELARLMGGDISQISELGVGSTFTLAAPLAKATSGDAVSADELEDPSADLSPALRILAAEDNLTNQIVLTALLEQFGVDLTLVANGRLAVEAWRDGAYDLILMDVNMPEMDGLTATAMIRRAELETRRVRTPIVALTANAMTHQMAAYQGQGFDGVVAKPIDARRLLEAIQSACAPEPADTEMYATA